jgi:hypothetical protein
LKKNIVRYEAFTEVTMKNVVFWDIKTQTHYVSDTESSHLTLCKI